MIARIDYKTFQVPLWSLVALVAVALFKGHINALDGILGAGLMLVSLVASDWILKKETIGGGDFWLGIAMSLFMGFDKFLIAYTIAALFGLISMMTINRDYRIRDVAYAPYLAYGAFWAMFIAK